MSGPGTCRRKLRAVLAAAAFLVGSVGLVTGASPAGAVVATTQHLLPAIGASGVTFLCGPDWLYSCTPGYDGTNAPEWAETAYGCPSASGCPTTPHNCQLYAAYRLNQVGVNPKFTHDPSLWDSDAAAKGYPVDQSPAVGSIAQWNVFKGHVAYVQSTDASGITVAFDWWSSAALTPVFPNGYTARVRIAAGSPAWPDNFIHFKDVVASYKVKFSPTDLSLVQQAADHFGIPRRDALSAGAGLLVFFDALARPTGLGPLTPPVASAGPGSLTATYYDRGYVNTLEDVADRTGLTVAQLHDLGAHLLIYFWYLDTH